MIEHLPIVLVAAPLLAAPLCSLLPRGRAPWMLATALSWCLLVIAVMLLMRVQSEGVIVYALGGWAGPIGIDYRLDALSALMQVLICAIAAVVLPFAGRSVAAEVRADLHPGFYALMLLLISGMLGMVATGDAFNVFVFLEISSLSSYALIALGGDRRALLAAYRYLILGSIGATFYLIGIGLLYALTGTLNMADLAARLPAVADTRSAHTAVAFVVVGLGLKLALFPLHQWLPNAYRHAPSAVSTLLAATATKVAIYLLLRFVCTIFGIEFAFGTLALNQALMACAVIAMLAGSLAALQQTNVKAILAYSSIAQIGYIVLGLALATSTGFTASLLHLFNHALMKGALFMAMGCVMYRVGSTDLIVMRGIGRRMPWTMAAFVIAALSLIGVPLTAGFISKWYLIQAALELGWWPLVVAILVASLIALAYLGRIIEAAWLAPNVGGARAEAPWSMLLPLWVLAMANIYFGVDTRLPIGMAEQAARVLIGAAP